jgi:branched-chain amino acid transport system substrate-binding protein
MRIEMKRAMLIVLMMIFSTAAGCLGEDGGEITTDDIDDIIDQMNNNTTTDNSTDNTTNTTTTTDSDNDGVVDADDTCPNTPATDVVDANGCTVIPDADGDGVDDAVDQCPGTQVGTDVDDVGCPVPVALEVLIGLLSPQSGELSDLSESIERAANLAVNRMNEGQYVYEFTLIVEDSGCDATTAATATQSLADSGVSGIIGPACDAAAMSAMQVAMTEKIPLISYASSSPALSTAVDDGYMWRVVASIAYEGIAAATWAQLAQITNPAVLAKNSTTEAPIAQAFIASAAAAGIQLCYTSFYSDDTTDFSSDVAAIKAAGCDGVFLVSEFGDGNAIIEELNTQELLGEDGITVVGHGGIGDADFADEFDNPGLLDGIYGSRAAAPDSTLEVHQFIQRYRSAYGSEPGEYAPEVYDATTVLMLAVKHAESTDGESIRDALMTAGQEHAGASGDFSFSDNGDVPGAHFEFWKFTCEDCDDDGVGDLLAFEVVATWSPYNGIWANCRSGTPQVQIGVLYPATGADSVGGEGFLYGVQLSAMLINVQQRDICFMVISADTEGTATGAAVAAQELIDAGVVGIVGAADCAETMAATDVAVAAKTTIISYACTSPELTNYDDGSDTYGKGYLWRTTYSDAWPADAAADYAAEQGHSSVAVYRTDDANGDTLASSLTSAVGGTLCADITFTPGSLGTTADAVGCDAVVIFADAGDSAMIVDDLAAQGFTGEIIGNGAMDSDEFNAAVTTSTDNIVIVSFSEESFSSSLSNAFSIAYMMNYGTAPPAFSAEAADGGLIIAVSFIYGYNVGLSAQVNSEYVNWFVPAIADEYAGASGYLTVDANTGDMPSKGHFNVFRIVAGELQLEYTWDPMGGLETV